MENIFKGAKFGDKFITRNGRMAVFGKVFFDRTVEMFIEDDGVNIYALNGQHLKELSSNDELDIVGRWRDVVSEDSLKTIVKEYRQSKQNPYYNDSYCSIMLDWICSGFRDGYMKAKENNR